MPSRRDLANAIRALSMDAVQAANSGHPGMPMGMADIAEVLWNDHLNHNPSDPNWVDRDRVVISNGHGSMLPYSVLHLTGYDLPIEELKNFRQLHSHTPGHPEYGETPGVETTTGPLGQGLANAVGMALAEQQLARKYNRDGHSIVDHHTYVLLGDGCLMEGISHEVCSLAGTWKLGKLIAIYDDNKISIDGDTDGWFTDDTAGRFEAYGWHVVRDVDGHDAAAVNAAIEEARAETAKPTLICARTVIGYGSPNKAGTAATHGAALGEAEVAAVRSELGWPHAPFEIPQAIAEAWDAREKGKAVQSDWQSRFDAYEEAFPEQASEFARRMAGELADNWDDTVEQALKAANEAAADAATRKSSQIALNAYGPALPELIGGSADLAGSNNTIWSGSVDVLDAEQGGNYINFGVREFGMTAIANGLALHGGFIPYTATFLVFSDYARNAVRMSALIPTRAIHIYTHDSIGLGEDGPTHQPVEHVASLRLIPNLDVWRPCDTVESLVAWKHAVERNNGPSALIFTRQGTPHQFRSEEQIADISRGGYVLLETPTGSLDAIIVATGSEVGMAMDAARRMAEKDIGVRVVSMPCTELFEAQPIEWREGVLPSHVTARVVVEAGSTAPWYRYAGSQGEVVGIDRFGLSAPGSVVYEQLGMTVDAVCEAVERVTA